jgi:hypothetical protein
VGKRLLSILGAVALAAALSIPAQAGSLVLSFPPVPTGGEGQSPVEQQTDYPVLPGPLDCSANVDCVVNTTACRWDVDDHWQLLQVDRYLDPATSTSTSPCVIEDANPQTIWVDGVYGTQSGFHSRIGVSIIAPSADLVVTIAYSPQARTFTLSPVVSGRNFAYSWCGNAVYSPGDPALQPILGTGAGTNGLDGIGVPTTVTIQVSNPTGHRVRSIQADVEQVGVQDPGPTASCVASTQLNPAHRSYPFAWTP